MKAKSRRQQEWVKNIVIILMAVIVVVIFFNLDFIQKGESVFSQKAQNKVYFEGALKSTEFEEKEVDRIVDTIRKHNDLLEKVVIITSVDDEYRKVIGSTQVVFEVLMTVKNNGTISTPGKRVTRDRLVDAVLYKMNKDIKVYRRLKKEGKDFDSLINS